MVRATSHITQFCQPHTVEVQQQEPIDSVKAEEIKGFPHPGNYIDVPFGGRIMLQFDEDPTKVRNGAIDTDYLQAIVDRWKAMQSGPFANRYKAVALTKVQEAIMWIEAEQRDRALRNIRFQDIPAEAEEPTRFVGRDGIERIDTSEVSEEVRQSIIDEYLLIMIEVDENGNDGERVHDPVERETRLKAEVEKPIVSGDSDEADNTAQAKEPAEVEVEVEESTEVEAKESARVEPETEEPK